MVEIIAARGTADYRRRHQDGSVWRPLEMPLVRKLAAGLWEVRSRLPGRIARVLFTAGEGRMILLHGFIKKSQKTPAEDLELAKNRFRMLQ